MIRKLITTAFVAGFLAIGLGGCDWCCGGDAATEGAAVKGADCVDCVEDDGCYECDLSTPEAPAKLAADVAPGAEGKASCGLDMECGVTGGCSDELVEACTEAVAEKKANCGACEPAPECGSGGCSDEKPMSPLDQ